MGDASRFFDVDLGALKRDPIAMVHRIRTHFGILETFGLDARGAD